MVLPPGDRFVPMDLTTVDVSLPRAEWQPLKPLSQKEPNPLPSTFISFFPVARGHSIQNSTEVEDVPGTLLELSDWAAHFAVQTPKDRLPAWCRVPTAPSSRACCHQRTIMKRVGMPSRPRPRSHSPIKVAKGNGTEQVGRETRVQRRKLEHGSAEDHEGSFEGSPLTVCELEKLLRQAEVDVISHIAKNPSANLYQDVRSARMGQLIRVAGVKRRYSLDEDDIVPTSGLRLRTFTELEPYLTQMWAELGIWPHADQVEEDEEHRNPRTHLAAAGVPDLSTIEDETEPDGSLEFMIPRLVSAALTSPAKRKARLEGHNQSTASLGLGLIRLNPALAPASILYSPIKACDQTAPQNALALSSVLCLNENTTLQPKQLLPTGSGSNVPVKALKAPLSTSSHTTVGAGLVELSVTIEPVPSPVKRVMSTTPSQTRPSPVTTPQRVSSSPQTPQAQHQSDLGILASIHPSTPNLQATPSKWETEPQSFDFGATSQVHMNSRIDWLVDDSAETREAHRMRHVNKSRRRKSEPLVNKHLKKIQTSRRQSETPRTLESSLQEKTRQDATAAPEPAMATPTRVQGPDAASSQAINADLYTPLPKYFLERPPLSTARGNGTPIDRNGVYSVDMRRNPDIFNSRPTTSPAIKKLATMAEECCDGHAKVMVVHEIDKLVVRFKLPIKYASTFPQSQGADESHFTTTPSAIYSSPRIVLPGAQHSTEMAHQTSNPAEMTSGLGIASSPEKSCVFSSSPSPDAQDRTLIVGDFGVDDHTAETPRKTLANATHCDNLLETPAQQIPSGIMENPSSGLLDEPSFEPTFQTPTFGHLDFSPNMPFSHINVAQPSPKQPTPSKKPKTEDSISASLTMDTGSETQEVQTSPGGTPLATSFTPVNRSPPPNEGSASRNSHSKNSSHVGILPGSQQTPESAKAVSKPDEGEKNATKEQESLYDSPGREYMRAFIRSMKPKRLSTTETGSPIAHSPARVPLEAKSPNMGSESPRKTKRKLETDDEPKGSPMRRTEEQAAKRVRRLGNLSKEKPEEPKAKKKAQAVKQPPSPAHDPAPTVEQTDIDADDAQEPCRRSSRLSTTEKKSAIPTAIKLGRPTTGRDNSQGKLNSAVRSEQAELTRQTNMNTRKNKGKSESVQQILARLSEGLSEEDGSSSGDSDGSKTNAKRVVWRSPIASHQDEKPKKGRPSAAATTPVAAPKKKVTLGTTGVAKPKATPQKARISKVAQSLGMAGNGTPAKRMTRARTRSQN